MSDTVDAVVAEAIGTPTEAPAPAIVRREDVREQILNTEWQEDAPSGDQPTENAPPADSTIAHAPSSDEGAEAHANAPAEPPAEAVIGEGATRVVVRSADGKFTPAPDVKLEFQVGDKTYLKSPAELVRMARDGVAGQSYVQKAREYEQQLPLYQQQLQEMQQQLEYQAALNRELLDDESAYYERRSQWQEMNSPEARLARYEQERVQHAEVQRAQQEQAQRTQVVQAYYTQEIQPVQQELLQNFPQVSMEAKLGRISMDTMPLLQNGVVPPHRLPEYKAYLDGPFRQWVQEVAARVDAVNKQREAQLQQTIRQGQQKAQQVVQSVGRQLAPNGRPGADTPPPSPKPRNREEAKMAIISRPWQD